MMSETLMLTALEGMLDESRPPLERVEHATLLLLEIGEQRQGIVAEAFQSGATVREVAAVAHTSLASVQRRWGHLNPRGNAEPRWESVG